MYNCPECDHGVGDNAKKCPECGEKLKHPIRDGLALTGCFIVLGIGYEILDNIVKRWAEKK